MIRVTAANTFSLVHVTSSDFLGDSHGRRYADVANADPQLFAEVISFFDDEHRHQRLIDAEVHHDRPALSGVVAELEHQPWFEAHMMSTDAHKTQRLRQAIGVLVRLIMENYGFGTTGRKGLLGRREKVAPGTTTPGAYHNTSGISLWFGSAERYALEPKPYEPVKDRAMRLPKSKPQAGPAAPVK